MVTWTSRSGAITPENPGRVQDDEDRQRSKCEWQEEAAAYIIIIVRGRIAAACAWSRQESTVQVLKQSRSVFKVLETDTSFGSEEVVVSPGSKRRDTQRHTESSVHVFFLCPKSWLRILNFVMISGSFGAPGRERTFFSRFALCDSDMFSSCRLSLFTYMTYAWAAAES